MSLNLLITNNPSFGTLVGKIEKLVDNQKRPGFDVLVFFFVGIFVNNINPRQYGLHCSLRAK